MSNKTASALLILTISSCGFDVYSQRISHVDSYIEPYVQKFESIYGASIGDVDVHFGALMQPNVGWCLINHHDSYESREITIDPSFWFNYASEEAKVNIVFHELGHCVLDRDHIEDRFSYESDYGDTLLVPSSFMFPSVFFFSSIGQLEDYYEREMIYPETRR